MIELVGHQCFCHCWTQVLKYTYSERISSRFGHSLIRPNMTLLTEEEARAGWVEGSKLARNAPLRQVFHNPALIFQGELDNLVRGIVMSPMMPMDRVMSPEVVNHLFEKPDMIKSGMDLAALNIQRGRDHGLPGLSFPSILN